jgi:glycosyltransferase involved in cell wall biosynthesis
MPKFGHYDGIVIEKEFLPYLPGGLEHWFMKLGRKISLDYDDPVYLTYEGIRNPVLRVLFAEKIKRIMRASAFVTVGNTYLESYARSCSGGVYIIPPAIDLRRYDLVGEHPKSGELRVGWIGTPFTLKYVVNLSVTLQELSRSHSFRLILIGVDHYALDNVCVEVKKWDYDSEVADLKSLDIGIMPLTDEEWSRGKCGIKLLQYMAAGVPAVASPVGINAEIIRDGENGFLAANEQEWTEKLSRLVADPDLRARLGREGRRTVEELYSLDRVAERLVQIYKREFQ